MSKIKNGFVPIFSGIVPSANMVLPTYYRQLQYIEKVLNQLVKDVNDNFIEFDKYNREQFEDIKEIVREITNSTIKDEVQKEILKQIQEIINSFEDTMNKIQEVKDELEIELHLTDSKVSQLEIKLNDLQDELANLSISMNIVLSDANKYTDEKVYEVQINMEEELQILNTSIQELGTQFEDIPNQIDSKVNPLSTRVTKLENDKITTDAQIIDLGNRIDSSSTVVLGKRVANIETDISVLQIDVDNIKSTTNPDVSGLISRIGEAESAININTNNLGITNNKITNLEINVNSINSDLVDIEDRLVILETPLETGLEVRVDNIESTTNLLSNRVSSLERLNIEDSIESLDSRLSTLEEINGEINPNYPLFIECMGNKIFLENNPWEDFVSYKGKIFIDIVKYHESAGESGMNNLIMITTPIPEPLNLDPNSGISNKIFINEYETFVRDNRKRDSYYIYLSLLKRQENEGEDNLLYFDIQNTIDTFNRDNSHEAISDLTYDIIIDLDIKIPKVQ